MNFFDSTLPEIQLVGAVQTPYNLSIATARTCYSSQGIITPQEVSKDEKSRLLRDKIAVSTREAGHLTTRQHAHFVFALSRISRSFIWEFLHSHPFYNSEQVSQRYVKVRGGNFTIPKFDPKDKHIYEQTLGLQMEAYEKLIRLLLPAVSSEYYRIFPNRNKEDRWQKVIQKKAYEIARYVLPIATHAYLYHTVSALTLLRYWRAAQREDASEELKYVVGRMVEEVLKIDPDFEKELSHSERSEESQRTLQRDPSPSAQDDRSQNDHAKEFAQTFDSELRSGGVKFSRLIDYPKNTEQTLARAVRSVFAKNHYELSDEEAIDLVLNPALNRSLGDTLNMMTLSDLSRALCHVHFTFQKKLSHTADSQNQRHRMTPASRPKLEFHYFGEPDVVYPKLILHV
ncbi:MAG: FAD-dependent thymidylate synthase, partial [Deltaproteobacteria bacterium]